MQGDEISFVFDQCDRDLVCHTVSYCELCSQTVTSVSVPELML